MASPSPSGVNETFIVRNPQFDIDDERPSNSNIIELIDTTEKKTGRNSIEWYADFKTFPADIDRRCIGEIILGEKTNAILGSFLNNHRTMYFSLGIALHVVGIGSISGIQECTISTH